MTKLIAAVAAMILVEECTLRLDEPVERWLYNTGADVLGVLRGLRSLLRLLGLRLPGDRRLTVSPLRRYATLPS